MALRRMTRSKFSSAILTCSGPQSQDDGQSDAINKGFLRATGDLVGWLNADDYYLPGGLEAIAHAAEEHPEADIIYGDCVFVDGRWKDRPLQGRAWLRSRHPDVLRLLHSIDLDVLSPPRHRIGHCCSIAITGYAWTSNTSPGWPMPDASFTMYRDSLPHFAGMETTSA